MHVPLTNGIVPLDMLSHLPPLPLIIYYRGRNAAEEDSGATRQRDRICRIVLQIPSPTLDKLTEPMDEPFRTPVSLSLSSTSGHTDGTKIVTSTPNLLHLTPFTCVRKLCIGYPLASELSNALESGDEGLLPELQELEAQVELGHFSNAFATFADARQLAGRRSRLSVSPVTICTTVPALAEDELPGPFQSTPDVDVPLISLPAPPVQKNWFRKTVVEPVRRRLLPRTTRTGG
jgi:hypothetical protein